ncbi:hypothetical protein [Erythrobacter sp. F6033]|uniref:hypothetical protein n=1 Tax=Erythrobacter sp. F6033 TaxID=2926401 RepID=UPI001FF6B507|nr:hypothetical protein [Erythrobacter sp. F6033]MCK0127280.1 hypothetical protein [Erythrobacter sp. F6033]
MRAKWRLFVLLFYGCLLFWESVTIGAPHASIADVPFTIVLMLVALAPVVFLCLVPRQTDAMGIVAILVIGFGVWGYDANDGDPIGLLILIFYQYCATGVGALMIILGAHFLKAKS